MLYIFFSTIFIVADCIICIWKCECECVCVRHWIISYEMFYLRALDNSLVDAFLSLFLSFSISTSFFNHAHSSSCFFSSIISVLCLWRVMATLTFHFFLRCHQANWEYFIHWVFLAFQFFIFVVCIFHFCSLLFQPVIPFFSVRSRCFLDLFFLGCLCVSVCSYSISFCIGLCCQSLYLFVFFYSSIYFSDTLLLWCSERAAAV